MLIDSAYVKSALLGNAISRRNPADIYISGMVSDYSR
jgi:hypothetical protein